MEQEVKIGTEEGEVCNRGGCKGIIEVIPDSQREGGCSCHINPPCSFCTFNPQFCPECGWEPEQP